MIKLSLVILKALVKLSKMKVYIQMLMIFKKIQINISYDLLTTKVFFYFSKKHIK